MQVIGDELFIKGQACRINPKTSVTVTADDIKIRRKNSKMEPSPAGKPIGRNI